MAWTPYQIFLAILMVITGSINTIAMKWADRVHAKGRLGEIHKFDHPFFQASTMFVGEMLCLLAFKLIYMYYSKRQDESQNTKILTKGNRDFHPCILLPPAMCDMTATSIMYIGLNLTYASSFQMLRGSVIVFTGLLSMLFLHRRLTIREWVGIFFVILGLTLVGVADFIGSKSGESHTKGDIVIGDVLIVVAQLGSASQMVYEEKYVTSADIPPLQAIGWEGIFGFTVMGLLQIPFYFVYAWKPFTSNPTGQLEDAIDAFVQMSNSWKLIVAILITIISIAFFNFAGISVTKEISATTRMVLDSIRTIIIWIFSLACFEQIFHWLQLVGFLLLLVGMFLYNDISCKGCVRALNCRRRRQNEENENKT